MFFFVFQFAEMDERRRFVILSCARQRREQAQRVDTRRFERGFRCLRD